MFHVTVFDWEACDHPKKNLEVASPIWKATASEKVVLREEWNSSSLGSGDMS